MTAEGAAHDEGLLSWRALEEAIEHALSLPEPPPSRWHRAGVGARGERIFERASAALLLVFTIGWTWSIATAHARAAEGDDEDATSVTSRIASSLTDPDAPSVAFLTDAALGALAPLRGESGRLRARIQPGGAALPVDSLPAGATIGYATPGAATARADSAPPASGIWNVVIKAGNALRPVADFSVITLVPSTARRNGRIGLYYIGSWPTERARNPKPNYAAPSGFIEVTPENQDTWVSDHFRLRDFLTHDQQGVWPKYLVVQTPLLDKLELVLADLEAQKIRTAGVTVMSGFRTPQYNRGGGNTRGRAEMSRHMYGDAADIFIDNDGNGTMDDLNHDGRINIADARVILAAVERVERDHPALVGGAGVYVPGSGHGPFIHIDTRGYRARWIGTGD